MLRKQCQSRRDTTQQEQETISKQEQERSKKYVSAGGTVEKEKHQNKANCPERNRSKKDNQAGTERTHRKRNHIGAAE